MHTLNELATLDLAQIASQYSTCRRFGGLSYSGCQLEDDDGNLVVHDVHSMRANDYQLPVTLNHDTSRIVGCIQCTDIHRGGVLVAGVVWDPAVFPYAGRLKMSIRADPKSSATQRVREGQTIEVNGRQFVGPIIVYRESVLAEVALSGSVRDSNTWVSIQATDLPIPDLRPRVE